MKNLTCLWSNLFRAIEIAKTGGYSVSVHFDKEYKSGFEDYNSVKLFCKGWFDNFVSEGDIKIDFVKPYSYERLGICETLEDISVRVEKSIKFPKPELKLFGASETLLKTAMQRMDFSLAQCEKIKLIASTIAQMSFSEMIKPEHTAESIQYQFVNESCYYSAEAKSIVFGDMIQIKAGKIERAAIESAVKYLNNLSDS